MPFYEYECQKCGHKLEAMQKISDPPLRKCPDCGKSALRKLMSSPVFRLKGSGWYETDFKSDKEGKRNLADQPEKKPEQREESKAPAPTTDAKSETKTETQPAAKSEQKSAIEAKPAAVDTSIRKRGAAASRTRKRVARRPK
jgi:putative FmdB family regulatory protein